MRKSMAARRATSATVVGALAVAGLGLAASSSAAVTSVEKVRASDITTWDATGSDPAPTGWFAQADDQIGNGAYALVASPEGGDGDGNLRLTTPTGTDKATLKKLAPAGTALADVASGSYQVKTTTGAAPAYQIVIDCNGGTLADSGFSTLNYLPTQAPADGWKTWDTVSAGTATYWSTWNILTDGTTSGATVPEGKTVAIPRFENRPLSDFQAACADGLALTYGVSVGRDEAHVADVDHVAFNGSETNFQVVTVDRFAGSDRVATAVEVSQGLFPDKGDPDAAHAAVVATAKDFADGLAGGPLAVAADGPLLLTNAAFLDGRVATELQRLLAAGAPVYVLGGTNALSDEVEADIAALGFEPIRLAGATRFSTAVEIANEIGTPDAIFLTSGTNFPDALSASPAAVRAGGVLLLTRDSAMTAETLAYLSEHSSATRFAIGGPAAQAAGSLVSSANRIVGVNRFDTAVRTAQRFFTGSPVVTFASGRAFPDALGGGAFAGFVDAPMLLVEPGSVPAVLAAYLEGQRLSIDGAALFGGTAAVSASVETALTAALN